MCINSNDGCHVLPLPATAPSHSFTSLPHPHTLSRGGGTLTHRCLHTDFLIRHGLSFISDLGQCRAYHLISTLIHPHCQGRLNQTVLWTLRHLTRLVVTTAKSKKEKARRAPACLLLRVASCLMRGCLQHSVAGNTAHVIRPIASLRIWRLIPQSHILETSLL